MVLSEAQKAIIEGNPKASVRDLAKMAKCDPKTITSYRKKLKERAEGKPVGIPVGNSKEDCGTSSSACDKLAAVGNPTLDAMVGMIQKTKFILSPEDMFKIGTAEILQHYGQYNLAMAKLEADPDNPKLLWTMRQHQDSLNRVMSMMGKWHGLERESVVNNILNIGNTVNVIPDKQLDKLEEYVAEKTNAVRFGSPRDMEQNVSGTEAGV